MYMNVCAGECVVCSLSGYMYVNNDEDTQNRINDIYIFSYIYIYNNECD